MIFKSHKKDKLIIPKKLKKENLVKKETKIVALSFSISSIDPINRKELIKDVERVINIIRTTFINFILLFLSVYYKL